MKPIRRFRRLALTLGFGLCAALVASGCLIYEERVVFDAGGGGWFELTCGIDLSALGPLGGMGAMSGMSPSTGDSEAVPADEDDSSDCGRDKWTLFPAPGAQIEDFIEAADGKEMKGIRVSAPFSSSTSFGEVIGFAQVASTGESGNTLGSTLSVAVQGGTYTLTGHILPVAPTEAEAEPFVGVLLATARRSLTLTLPGHVLSADADSRDGQTYTWRQEPSSSVPRPVNVSWNPAGQPAESVNPITPTTQSPPARTPAPARTPIPTATPQPTLSPEMARLTTATRVYGQAGSFTTDTGSNGGVSATSMEFPFAVAADRSGGRYVADPDLYRVLYFPAGASTATRVYGQPDFNTGSRRSGTSVTADGPLYPFGLVVSAAGELYVSDSNNNRVLFYPAGATIPTRVYGQGGSFTTGIANVAGVNASSLSAPEGLALDTSGGLYVADTDNARVLYFPAGQTTATRVYGQQGSFSTNSPNRGGISAQSLHSPMGVALDGSGGLYVADGGNSRVVLYPSGSTMATRVYGQLGDFTTDEANKGSLYPGADTLSVPRGIATDAAGGLYVADVDNNRVLYYTAGSTTAARVYGQRGSFTSNELNNGGIGAMSLRAPNGVALDSSGNLYVADSFNSRVLVFPTN